MVMTYLCRAMCGGGGLVAESLLRDRTTAGPSPDSAVHTGPAYAKCEVKGQTLLFGCSVEAQRRSVSSRDVPAYDMATPEHGSKLRGPSQNSPCVASKQDVNVIKLN
ncbi:hypothetical protein AVEN_63458-1 [Araneus ventricosus]|uniref:Uncharacterized protein n=1 Tax=Araneus ventricosus TaxID=182803 RepID=A0A4Y2CRB8_ARAVE|nr:hypothetical protein AVEN_63458-1 [Araneus ventricosus]